MKVWLIGGTGDSVVIAESLLKNGFEVVVTVATSKAVDLYDCHGHMMVIPGKIPPPEMRTFIQDYGICAVVDASHPFAMNVSQGAIALSQQEKIPYLRYERPSLSNRQGMIEFPDFPSLLKSNLLTGKRVLLTIGCQSLSFFQNYHHQIHLYARVLPYADSITQANAAGFKGDRLIALRPPISLPLEKALWQQWNIQAVVTKAAGKPGGQDIKQKLAQALQIPLIIIQRPNVSYPHMVRNVDDIVPWLSTWVQGREWAT